MTRVIMEKLISGEDISLKGFGSFKIKERKSRKGRNPQTGKEIKIPKTKAVKFNPSKDMKESVKKNKKNNYGKIIF